MTYGMHVGVQQLPINSIIYGQCNEITPIACYVCVHA